MNFRSILTVMELDKDKMVCVTLWIFVVLDRYMVPLLQDAVCLMMHAMLDIHESLLSVVLTLVCGKFV